MKNNQKSLMVLHYEFAPNKKKKIKIKKNLMVHTIEKYKFRYEYELYIKKYQKN